MVQAYQTVEHIVQPVRFSESSSVNFDRMEKLAYTAPRLHIYGNLAELTAGGSGTESENAGNSDYMGPGNCDNGQPHYKCTF